MCLHSLISGATVTCKKPIFNYITSTSVKANIMYFVHETRSTYHILNHTMTKLDFLFLLVPPIVTVKVKYLSTSISVNN